MGLEGHEIDRDMMTPKEKAKELVDSFYNTENCHKKHTPNNRYCDCSEMNMFQAKQCALMCVDEIISTGSLIRDEVMTEPSHISYWEDVITELNLIV